MAPNVCFKVHCTLILSELVAWCETNVIYLTCGQNAVHIAVFLSYLLRY